MRCWPQDPQSQLAMLQLVLTSSFLGFVFVEGSIGDAASITIAFTRVKVGAFATVELESEAFPSFTVLLMLTVVVVVIVVMIEAFSLRHAIVIEQ